MSEMVGACREMTFEEEAQVYEDEASRLFRKEAPGSEPPFANCIVRRGKRIIIKARNEIADTKAQAEKIISVLQEENEKLNKELEKYRVIKSVTNMILRGDAE